MSSTGHHPALRFLLVTAVVLMTTGGRGVAQDAGAPPWGEFLKRFEKDPLLKKPFHMMPEDEVKGLASKIRARELDVPNRKRAIRYLRDLDCTQFPEAKEMLLSLLDPEVEKWEEVRFEAATALRDMLARHSCNPEAAKNAGNAKNGKGNSKGRANTKPASCESNSGHDSLWQQCCQTASNTGKRIRGERTKPQDPPCHCTSCCDAATMTKLAKTAYEMKEDGCCYEPSLRVREMAVEAIKACGIPCHYKPYYGTSDEEPGPPAWDESGGRTPSTGEDTPPEPREGENPPSPREESGDDASALEPSTTTLVTPISRLANLCIVSLVSGEHVKPDPQISAIWRGRLYYFSSEAAKREFLSHPERYAVAFGGCDPVHYVRTRQAVEGRFLAMHDGRLLMFATRENHEAFKADPSRFLPGASQSDRVASNR